MSINDDLDKILNDYENKSEEIKELKKELLKKTFMK